MPLYKDIMGGGSSAFQARAMGGSIAATVSAAGTVITDATDLVASKNIISTVGSGAGVQLYSMSPGESQIVYNAGANALKVFPPSSTSAINQIAVGVAVTLAVATACEYHCISATQIVAVMSA